MAPTIQLLRHPGHHDHDGHQWQRRLHLGSADPSQAGDYSWTASYDGDGNNNGVSETSCTDPNEQVTITKATPTLSTNASAGGPVGTSITDTATLAGGASTPTGTITFNLYGPHDPNCTGTPVTTTKSVSSGNGDYTSTQQTPSQAGNYSWTASYNGDSNNNAVSETSCTTPSEQVTITSAGKASPTLTTTASAGGPVGTPITDKATLAGGATPTGTITFNLYGPNDPTCAGTPLTTTTTVSSGNGDYTSDSADPKPGGELQLDRQLRRRREQQRCQRDQLHRSQRAGHDHQAAASRR